MFLREGCPSGATEPGPISFPAASAGSPVAHKDAASGGVCAAEPAVQAQAPALSRSLVLIFALSAGVIVTNLFATQPLTALIGPSLGLDLGMAGLVGTLTLLGYASGLFFIVPLADLVENRVLVLRILACATVLAAATGLAPAADLFLVASFGLGAACSIIQILVPLAAGMAPERERGRVVGEVMSGVMLGILLSRPLAGMVADLAGWRAFYGISCAAMAAMGLLLARFLPRHRPPTRPRYGALIASLLTLLREESVLRRRALTSSLVMAAFSLFWTSVALRLAGPPFDLTQRGIALFALVGAAGALAAPLAGRLGDGGQARAGLIGGHLAIIAGSLAALAADGLDMLPDLLRLALLGLSAILLDVGGTTDQTLGRRAVQLLRPEARGRLNGLFVGLFFIGGALGSLVAGFAWTHGGWPLVCLLCAAFGAAALAVDFLGGRD